MVDPFAFEWGRNRLALLSMLLTVLYAAMLTHLVRLIEAA